VFCLTFEVEFFSRHGFRVIDGTPVPVHVYAELLRSMDEGVAGVLDLARGQAEHPGEHPHAARTADTA
jgi:amino-acid N-acetyltransferase